jgi:hypothetical protein
MIGANYFKGAIAAAALAVTLVPVHASAGVVETVTMDFASGATFIGEVTFTDDFSSYYAVSGILSGGPYGSDAITAVWAPGYNYSTGTGNFSNWLVDGTPPDSYSVWIQFAYNYSVATGLTFTSGASFEGFDNAINYADPMIHGSISAAPEPATWAMMGLGFASLGFAGWRVRRKTPVALV